ncbi:glycosyl hydrolase [Roseivirga sp. E12]|uniref:WD40/YVTN/BNR-like repeat-containing protein n=1 Tax=Roseivirga sp. E12 TaxID=2819237 RepID=UPI001ABD2A5E|nr:glycosyl hydrolase [Roseivirga sp. E12]MBO3697378.1 glycosyl hydrolase [Roseivirga sp. E12]
MKLIIGTDKGLIIYEKIKGVWKLSDIHFIGMPIGAFHQDAAGHWWVAINHKHWGPKLYISKDQGETFDELTTPKFDPSTPYSLKSIWKIESQSIGPIERLYVGTEPAALFLSKDGGQSFQELSRLSKHESRSTWQGGGKGSNSPFLHTLVMHPDDSNALIVGISCAGVFQSQDLGNIWKPSNKGLKSFFLPNSEIEVGHDPHIILRHPRDSNILWQQNHCGIYRSEDGGHTWNDVSDPNGKAAYGFAMVIDEEDVNTAWVIPAQSDDLRYPIQNKLAVYKTTNAGKSWKAQSSGLPQEAAFDLVLRASFARNQQTMAFGSNNGNLYLSEDNGEHWQVLSQSLSSVRNVLLIE